MMRIFVLLMMGKLVLMMMKKTCDVDDYNQQIVDGADDEDYFEDNNQQVDDGADDDYKLINV